jgi:hypothetical protein
MRDEIIMPCGCNNQVFLSKTQHTQKQEKNSAVKFYYHYIEREKKSNQIKKYIPLFEREKKIKNNFHLSLSFSILYLIFVLFEEIPKFDEKKLYFLNNDEVEFFFYYLFIFFFYDSSKKKIHL